MRRRQFLLAFLVCLCLYAYPTSSQATEPTGKVYVILWFDTEDYLLPASDDAALKLAELLSKLNIRATFKVVGEKARTLSRRERTDVIDALKKHEIGYHSNWHSTQPSPAMYLSALGWDEGIAEFDRREGPGRDDVEKIFGVAPSCYGQPGSSWGPQSYGAMRKWNMPVYLDAGNHVNLDEKPCYYGGVFNLYKLAHTIRADINDPKLLDKAKERFTEAREKLKAEGGGIVSTVYHPCEFVHKEFWDGVNFRKGANPQRLDWKQPKQKTSDETKTSFQIFEEYVQFMKRFDDVEFITASQAAKLYRDRAKDHTFDLAELREIAKAVGSEISFQSRKDFTLSASEVFLLLHTSIAENKRTRTATSVKLTMTPDGPSAPASVFEEAIKVAGNQMERTSLDVADYLKKHGRVPSTVWLGSVGVPPEAYLEALARVAPALLEGGNLPDEIEIKPTKLTAAKYVSGDDPKLWTWVIFPPNFKAPAMMELAKRQAWSLKPAVLGRE